MTFKNFASLSGYSPVPMYSQGQMGMPEVPQMFTDAPAMPTTNWGSQQALPRAPGSFGSPTYANGLPDTPEVKNWWDGMVGTTENPGWGKLGMGALGGLATGFMGMKQYGLAQQQLAQHQQEFETNFAAQKGLTNANLQDRQTARVASNPGAYQSVGAYMNQNGVK
jgi:hypothetical protein